MRNGTDTQAGIEPGEANEENHYVTIIDINMVAEMNAAQLNVDTDRWKAHR